MEPRTLSRLWWVQAPLVCGVYLAVSTERWAERLMLAYLAFVSVAAMGATYAGKQEAHDAKRAARGDDGDEDA